MKVREVMTKDTIFCGLDTPLSEAVESMWKRGCGFLPVVGEKKNVIGVITEHDLSIAFGTGNRRSSELLARDAMPEKLITCTEEDNIYSALNTMDIEGLRRLPVIDRDGALVGVLSFETLVLQLVSALAKRGCARRGSRHRRLRTQRL